MMKFLADRTTGKLARKLRALGYDVVSPGGGQLAEAAGKASHEGRILLTRSRRVPGKSSVPRTLILEADRPREQVLEVLQKLNLEPQAADLFTRCLLCNEKLLSLSKSEVEERVPEFIYRTYDSFQACPQCARVYWPGTHLRRMEKDFGERDARKKNP